MAMMNDDYERGYSLTVPNRLRREVEDLGYEGRAVGKKMLDLIVEGLRSERHKRPTQESKSEPEPELLRPKPKVYAKEDKGHIFTAGKSGICGDCGKSYPKGTEIVVQNGEYYHIGCFDENH